MADENDEVFVDMESVDDLQQRIVSIEETLRKFEWLRVDTVADAVARFQVAGLPKHKAARLAASAAQKREHWALLCLKLHEVFPADLRYPSLDLFIYRVALGANDPVAAIRLAADNQWSAKDLKTWIDQAQGKTPHTAIRLAGTMCWTGGDMVITPHEYHDLHLGEGLEAVEVNAVITTLR